MIPPQCSCCALRATVRLRGTEYESPYDRQPQTAALTRLSLGLSMMQPLRGCRRMLVHRPCIFRVGSNPTYTAPAVECGLCASVFWAIGSPLPLREGLGGGSSRGGLSLTPGKRSAARGGASVMDCTQRLEDARSTQCAVISLGCLAVDSSTMFMLRASRYRASSRHGVRVPV